jgi:hypothetical protein
MDADLVVLTPDLAVRETWVGGRAVYQLRNADCGLRIGQK